MKYETNKYYLLSGAGVTAKFAESIKKGASLATDIEVSLISIDGNNIKMRRYENNAVRLSST